MSRFQNNLNNNKDREKDIKDKEVEQFEMSLNNTSLVDVARDVKNSLYGGETKMLSGDKILLILTDGLGWNNFHETGIQECQKIRSVFPTITVTVMTTLLTAKSPGDHGILGWKVYDKRRGKVVDLLSAIRKGENPEIELPSSYLRGEESTFVTPLSGSSKRLFSTLVGAEVRNYFTPYDSLSVLRRSLSGKRFVFFYIPYVDTVSHHYGPSSPETAETVMEVSKIVKKAMEIGKSNGFTVVLTSDHGQIDVERNIDISRDQEILDKVEVPPFGDSRNLMIISRHDVSEIFRKYDAYVFNREMLSKYAGGIKVPDYAVVAKGRTTLNYWIDDSMEYKGNHGGISKDEMEIPLCVV